MRRPHWLYVLAKTGYLKKIVTMYVIVIFVLSATYIYIDTRRIPEGAETAVDWTDAQRLAKARADEQKAIAERDLKIEQEKIEAEKKAKEEKKAREEAEKKRKEEAERKKKAEEEEAKKAEEERLAKEQQEAEEQARIAQTQTQQPAYNGAVLTKSAGTIMGPSGKETYYNLPMEGVLSIMRSMGNTDEYWVREDGVKMLGDYVMIAAALDIRPRGSLVETSLGTGIVCDTGGFAYSNPTQIDIAVTW